MNEGAGHPKAQGLSVLLVYVYKDGTPSFRGSAEQIKKQAFRKCLSTWPAYVRRGPDVVNHSANSHEKRKEELLYTLLVPASSGAPDL